MAPELDIEVPRGSDETVAVAFALFTFGMAIFGELSGPWSVVVLVGAVAVLLGTAYSQQRRFRDENGVWIASAIWAAGPHPGRKPIRARVALIVGYVALFLLATLLAASADWVLAAACSAVAGLWVWITSRWWMRLYREEFSADGA